MSCATVDWYRGQFPLELCQITVIVKRHSKAVGFACVTLHGKPLQATSRYHCIPVC